MSMEGVSIKSQELFSTSDYAVVILNREIHLGGEFFFKIWNNACIRQVVDGGTNHFYALLDSQPEYAQQNAKFPDLASGDFDSINKTAMCRLKASTCKIVVTADQDETDFTKALKVLYEHAKEKQIRLKNVIVICESTGRLDQVMANLNTLHKNVFLQTEPKSTQIFLMGSECMTWLLQANQPYTFLFKEEHPELLCGIVPLVGTTRYTSTGLKWDLSPDMPCQFGGLVSTSNQVANQKVEITSLELPSIFTVHLMEKDYA